MARSETDTDPTGGFKRLAILGSALALVLVVALVAYLMLSLDAIVARAIEREGTRVVGAPVDVASVDIEIGEGRGTIRGLRVTNPEGFGRGRVLELEDIVLTLDLSSLREPPLRLVEVDVGETHVNLEVDAQGRSNLDRVVRHARERSAEAPSEPGEPTRIAIDRLHFSGGSIGLDRPGADETAEIALASFDREGIGGAQGATGGEIAKIVLQSLARQVAASTAGSEAQRAIEKELGGAAGEAAGSLVRGILGD